MYLTIGVVVLVLLYIYATRVEPYWFQISRHTHTCVSAYAPVRVLFLSDLHIRPSTVPLFKRLHQKVLGVLKREQIDLIFIGGDLLDDGINCWNWLTSAILQWKETLPYLEVLVVFGNHDHGLNQSDLDTLIAKLERVDARVHVANRFASPLTINGVQIIGLPDLEEFVPYKQEARKNPLDRKGLISAARVCRDHFDSHYLDCDVFGGHNPDVYYIFVDYEGKLFLTGHTHGGQFWPYPFFYVLIRWLGIRGPNSSFRCRSGEFKLGNTMLIISRGAGCSAQILRFRCRPEIHVIDINPAHTG